MQAAEITPPPTAATEWSRLLLRDVSCNDCVTVSCSKVGHSVAAGGDGSAQRAFCPWWS